MFSGCLPLSRSRDPRRALREDLIHPCRHWARAQRSHLWPSAQRDPKSCLRKTEDLGDLPLWSPSERPVWHITESSLKPGPEDGHGWPPTQSLAQVYVPLPVASFDLQHQVHLPPSGLEDLQSLAAEPEAEKARGRVHECAWVGAAPVPSQEPGAAPSEEPGVRAGVTAAPEPEEGPPPATAPPPQAALAPGPASGEAPSGAQEPTQEPAPLQAGLTPTLVLAPAGHPRPCLDPLTLSGKLTLNSPS